jgi:hypothetical protein
MKNDEVLLPTLLTRAAPGGGSFRGCHTQLITSTIFRSRTRTTSLDLTKYS